MAVVQLRAPNKAKSCSRDKDVIIVVQNLGTEQTIGTTTLKKDGQIVTTWESSNFSSDKSGRSTIEYIYSPAEDSGLVSWEACVSTPYDIDPVNNCMTDSSEIIPCN